MTSLMMYRYIEILNFYFLILEHLFISTIQLDRFNDKQLHVTVGSPNRDSYLDLSVTYNVYPSLSDTFSVVHSSTVFYRENFDPIFG